MEAQFVVLVHSKAHGKELTLLVAVHWAASLVDGSEMAFFYALGRKTQQEARPLAADSAGLTGNYDTTVHGKHPKPGNKEREVVTIRAGMILYLLYHLSLSLSLSLSLRAAWVAAKIKRPGRRLYARPLASAKAKNTSPGEGRSPLTLDFRPTDRPTVPLNRFKRDGC
jgi:hypothetical protein